MNKIISLEKEQTNRAMGQHRAPRNTATHTLPKAQGHPCLQQVGQEQRHVHTQKVIPDTDLTLLTIHSPWIADSMQNEKRSNFEKTTQEKSWGTLQRG